jgi:hypothetical protein
LLRAQRRSHSEENKGETLSHMRRRNCQKEAQVSLVS